LAIARTKRERRKALKALTVRLATSALLGALIVAALYGYDYLTTSDRLAITKVEFNGLSRLQQSDVERLASDLVGQNILLVPLEDYAARFGGHARIKSASFKRVLPDRVICSLEEREPVALVFTNEFLEIDRDGMIMTPDDVTELLDLPIISGLEARSVRAGRVCQDGRVYEALATLAMCKRYGGPFAEDVSEVHVSDSGISITSLKEGVVLLVGDDDHESRLKKYFLMRQTIAQKEESAQFIDLRFDDQIVLRSGI
jgi:cell division protein FtsQ